MLILQHNNNSTNNLVVLICIILTYTLYFMRNKSGINILFIVTRIDLYVTDNSSQIRVNKISNDNDYNTLSLKL